MRTLGLATLLTFAGFAIQAQNVRTFNNLELSTSVSRNTQQYSLFWGESLQITSPVPFRFTTGLRFSLNSKTSGHYLANEGVKLDTLSFDKKPWYSTFAVPLGLELFYKAIGIGVFQEAVSFSGKKSYGDAYTPLREEETLRTQGFSHVFGKKHIRGLSA